MPVTMEVISTKPTPSGKSLIVQVAGRKDGYLAKLDCGIKPGTTIEAETKASEYNGKTNWWIEKWKLASAPSAPAPAPASAPAAPEQPQGRFTGEGVNMAYMPFTSNCVAHAIQAGLIKQPSDIFIWSREAYKAAKSLGDNNDDGDIPF